MVTSMRIQADRDVCIGAGMCVMTADRVFDQDDDGIVVIATPDVPVGEQEQVRRAVALCPSGALRIVTE
jgi:ferredoxin